MVAEVGQHVFDHHGDEHLVFDHQDAAGAGAHAPASRTAGARPPARAFCLAKTHPSRPPEPLVNKL
jgi:hypothetical protein